MFLSYSTVQLNAQNIITIEKLPEVVVKGTGEENLLLIPCMSCIWEEFMERNKGNYTMYAITVPGFGATPVHNLAKNSEITPYRDYLIARTIWN